MGCSDPYYISFVIKNITSGIYADEEILYPRVKARLVPL
jgi:hypothetical protein